MKILSGKVAAFLLIVVLTCSPAYAQKLSAEERKIVDHVDAQQAEAIALLENVTNIMSPTENLAGVREVGAVFRKEFESLGMEARWIEMPAEMKRAGHLFATTRGARGKRVLLLGHIDTVLSGEKFRREGARAYGTGTSDMKAGNVILLYALKALHASGALKEARVTVLLTGDEESAGTPAEVSRRDMVEAAKQSDLALSFEGTVRNTATVGRRGSSGWTLEVEAKTGHSSGIFSEGAGNGAIFEAARIVNQFYEALHKEKYLTFNPAVIVGGTEAELDGASSGKANGKSNVIPAKTIVRGDLRFISEAQRESARARMREIVARSLPGTSAKITFRDGIPAMTPTEGNYALLRQLDEVSRDLGFGAVEALDPGERGAGDIAYVAHLVPGLDGIGPKGGNAHAPGEWVDLESLPMLTKRAALLIYRLTR